MKVNMGEIALVQGDITNIEADVIVNAANSSLMGGGGVDGAIHRVGGPAILEECKKIRKEHGICPPGYAVITGAGNLNAKFVVHTVGPIWKGGEKNEPNILRAAYLNSLELAAQNAAKTVAFPSISTGAYGYPVDDAALVALKACRDFLLLDTRIDKIIFVLFSAEDETVYRSVLMSLA